MKTKKQPCLFALFLGIFSSSFSVDEVDDVEDDKTISVVIDSSCW